MATVLGLVAMISLIFMIVAAFLQKGNATDRMGAVGFLAFLFSLVGLVLGILSLREKDSFRLFPRLGFGFSLLGTLGWLFMLLLGTGVLHLG